MRKIGERFLVRGKMPSPGPCDYFKNNEQRKLKSSKCLCMIIFTLNFATIESFHSTYG